MVPLILILAGPRELRFAREETPVNNIEICLDVSGSMALAFPPEKSKSDGAAKAIIEFTKHRNRDRDACGLTLFGSDVMHWLPLTRDFNAIRQSAPFLNPATLPALADETHIGLALAPQQSW